MMEKDKIRNVSVFMLQNESYEDSVIPFVKSELNRDVKIVDKVEVLGGIFCRNLELKSNDAFVQNSVYARDSISLLSNKSEKSTKGTVWFNSMVASGNSLLIEPNGNNLIRFGNSISSPIVNLTNCIVYGNIFCDQLILKNSVVLGTVYCNKELTIERSIVGSFHTKQIVQKGRFGLLHNFGFSEIQPKLTDKIFALSLVGLRGANPECIFEIGTDEIYPINDEEKGLKGFVLSPSLRFFDLSEMKDVLEDNVDLIIKIANINPDESREQQKIYQQVEEVVQAILDKDFEMVSKIPKSNFYTIQDEVLDTFVKETDVSEPDNTGVNQSIESNEEQSVLSDSNENKSNNEKKLNHTGEERDKSPSTHLDKQEENPSSEKEKQLELGTCPNCQTEISDSGMKYCMHCGQTLSQD